MAIRLIGLIGLLVYLGTAAADDAWYPSKWGQDDEIGSFNMLSPALTLEATKLVKTGKTYALGIESNSGTPAFGSRIFSLTIMTPNQQPGVALGDNKMNYTDDVVTAWLGVGSQIDGLGHVGVDDVYYNGWKSKDFVRIDGLTKFGIENIPPVVARGILIDMAMCMGKDMLEAGTPFNGKEIADCAKQEGIEIRKGDVVLFHTGWMNLLDTDKTKFGSGEPGLGVDGARFLASKEIMAVGSDTWGVEVIPFEDPNIKFAPHQELIPKNGIYILENMDTRELAKDKAYEFMFVLGPARFTGAVQMIINPVAIR
jgi:hypothetical protein